MWRARAARGLHAAVVAVEQVDADLVAVGVARLGGLDEPDPRAHEQRLDGRDRDVERAGEVGVGHAVDLAHQQRRALLLGQPADVLRPAARGPRAAAPPRSGRAAACARARRRRPPAAPGGAGGRCSGCGRRGTATRAGSRRARRRAARRRRARTRPAARPRRPGAGPRTASGARRRTAAGGSGRGSRRTPRRCRRGTAPAAARPSAAAAAAAPSGSRARPVLVRGRADASTASRDSNYPRGEELLRMF